MRWPALLALALSLLASCGGSGNLTVSVAASLEDAVAEIAAEFERGSGSGVSLNIGGSGTLATQIQAGAPADVVIFAGASPMDRLVSSGDVAVDAPVTIATNELVVVGQRNGADRAFPDVLVEQGGRVAIADPDLAPAGEYAVQALRSSGIYDEVESRLIRSLDVRAAVAAVETGAVRFGIVYATDALAFKRVEILARVPPGLHSPILYPAAMVARSGRAPEAEEFLQFLQSGVSQEILNRHGFITAGR